MKNIAAITEKFQQLFEIYNKDILHNFSLAQLDLSTGLNDFLTDLINNKGHISITTTDQTAFNVGESLAITPGKVIYQNDLIQLLQYLPTTKTVYKKPILFIPPWINKYYILDLTPEKSLVKWLVNQGFTVFMISWINPHKESAEKSWDHYLLEGPIAALDAITNATKCKSIHLAGYCIGGTLLASTLAYMQYNGDTRAASGSYFATLLDFSAPGALGDFVNEAQLAALKNSLENNGYLDGRLLDLVFNMLRPNDLIWPYFIKTYLLKQKPTTMDVLFWNADATHMPKQVTEFYLKNMYLNNALVIPNKIQINNTPINLSNIKVPVFFAAAEKDHIAPWQSIYSGIKLHNSNVTFALSTAGHVVGIVNPPSQNKYGFSINSDINLSPEQWLQNSTKHAGSWWPYWKQWLISHGKTRVPATKRTILTSSIIENAPGTYVLKRI